MQGEEGRCQCLCRVNEQECQEGWEAVGERERKKGREENSVTEKIITKEGKRAGTQMDVKRVSRTLCINKHV